MNIKNNIIKGILVGVMVFTLTSSNITLFDVNGEKSINSPKVSDASVDLAPGAYTSVGQVAMGSDWLDWEFQGTPDIYLMAYIMNSSQYAKYIAHNGNDGTVVSDGSFYEDYGSFEVFYTDTWYFVLENPDANEDSSNIQIFSLTLDPIYPHGTLAPYDFVITNSTFAKGGDYIYWEFLSTNPDVQIYAMIMDSVQYSLFMSSDPYKSYVVSAGIGNYDYADFEVPYTATWKIVYYNNDSTQLSTDIYDIIELSDGEFDGILLNSGANYSISLAATGMDSLYWNVDSTNAEVSLKAELMDSTEFIQYNAGNPYISTVLDDEFYITEYGQFTVPYTGTWVLVITNFHPSLSTDVNCSLTMTPENFGGTKIAYHENVSLSLIAKGGDYIDWDFEGSNLEIDLSAFMMDSDEYIAFQNHASYTFYNVTCYDSYWDYGSFYVPYTAEWYFVLINNDTDQIPTDVIYSISLYEEFFNGTLLHYGEYNYTSVVAAGGDEIDWEYWSTNYDIELNVWMMDSESFTNLTTANPFHYYDLNLWSCTYWDYGYFEVPYSSEWYLVLLNYDENVTSTDVRVKLTVYEGYFNGTLLPYNQYNTTNFTVDAGNALIWEFEGINPDVNITAWLMDAGNYSLFLAGEDFDYYNVSEGCCVCDWGMIEFPYSGDWCFLLLNLDDDQQPTEFMLYVYQIEKLNEDPYFVSDIEDMELSLANAQVYNFNWEIYDEIVSGNQMIYIYVNDELVFSGEWNPSTNFTIALATLIEDIVAGDYAISLKLDDGYGFTCVENFTLSILANPTNITTTNTTTTPSATTTDTGGKDNLTSIPGYNIFAICMVFVGCFGIISKRIHRKQQI